MDFSSTEKDNNLNYFYVEFRNASYRCYCKYAKASEYLLLLAKFCPLYGVTIDNPYT